MRNRPDTLEQTLDSFSEDCSSPNSPADSFSTWKIFSISFLYKHSSANNMHLHKSRFKSTGMFSVSTLSRAFEKQTKDDKFWKPWCRSCSLVSRSLCSASPPPASTHRPSPSWFPRQKKLLYISLTSPFKVTEMRFPFLFHLQSHTFFSDTSTPLHSILGKV